jgi:hypothetical protein
MVSINPNQLPDRPVRPIAPQKIQAHLGKIPQALLQFAKKSGNLDSKGSSPPGDVKKIATLAKPIIQCLGNQ